MSTRKSKKVRTNGKPAPKRPTRAVATQYSPEIGQRICERVALGQAIIAACKAERIHPRTWYRWLNDRLELNEALDRARRMRADQLASEILEIADDPDRDPHQARLMVDSRKWLSARFFPRMYGEPPRLAIVGNPSEIAVELSFDFGPTPPLKVIDGRADTPNGKETDGEA